MNIRDSEMRLNFGELLFNLLLLFGLTSCGMVKEKHTHDSSEPHEFVNVSYPDNDTIFVATIQHGMYNGPIKTKKKQGSFSSAMLEKIYNDAFSTNGWTHGNYRMNKKNGEWYYLNDQKEKVLSVNYKNDVLQGQYLRMLHNCEDTMLYCNYKDGLLHGKYISNTGSGMVNGVPLYGKNRWELNYFEGKMDGLQKRYYDGELMEQIVFKNGRILEIGSSVYVVKQMISDNGSGYIDISNASFAFGILGKQFSKKHDDRADFYPFTDGLFSGRIELCNGHFCPGELKLFDEILKDSVSFSISYDVNIIRK